MTYQQFISRFNEWKIKNNATRQHCRDLYKWYKTLSEANRKSIEFCDVFDYINAQMRPMTFLDSLFSKNPIIPTTTQTELFNQQVVQTDLFGNSQTYDNQTVNQSYYPQNQIVDNKYIQMDEIVECVKSYIDTNHTIPNTTIVSNLLGVNVKKFFNSEKDIIVAIEQKYKDWELPVITEDVFASDEMYDLLHEALKTHNKFVITTAVSGKNVCKNFLNSIKTYIKNENAVCLILPCNDVTSRKSAYQYQLPIDLMQDNFFVVHEDTYLNNHIYISNIKVPAKQINPQAGIPQFTQDGTVIIASPKQDLEFVANSQDKIPNASMSTGAITENDYEDELYMSKRTAKIAEYDHVIGAIIVEVEDDDIFHFRQIQSGSRGEFIDLGVVYDGDDIYKSMNNLMVIGDSHFGEHDEEVCEIEREMIKKYDVKEIVMHDVFSGVSISHHDEKKTITQAKKAMENKISLADEAEMVSNNLDKFAECTDKVTIVYSNHHTHLDRYMEEGRYAFDKVNLRYVLDIVKAFCDGETIPLRFMLENQTSLKNKDKLNWLEPDTDYAKYGFELSNHGHLGANGAKGSLTSYRKAYKMSISGHSHRSCIRKSQISVGTSSHMKLGYNHGLSSWINSVAMVYENGTFQLINIIKNNNGKYSWKN